MATSIRDIALALGLSKATVSCVLSGQGPKKRFSDETIKKVTDYANSINYQPNLLARSLSTGESKIIGLIVPFISDTFYAQMAQSVEAEALKQGYILAVCSSEGNGEMEAKLIKTLRAKQMDGIIIAPSKTSSSEIEQLSRAQYPFVLIDRYFPELPTNYVIVDNDFGASSLVEKIIGIGRRKIALLTTDTHLLVMNKRINGYKQALANNNIEYDPTLCVEVDRRRYKEDVVPMLDKLFKMHPDVDSFFFTTHYLALETIRYFIDNKIDYRKRFTLGCFHTTTSLDVLAPEMLIVEMPIDRMGQEAVKLLISYIYDKNVSSQGLVLKTRLLDI